jgi:hypothetical protein
MFVVITRTSFTTFNNSQQQSVFGKRRFFLIGYLASENAWLGKVAWIIGLKIPVRKSRARMRICETQA